MPVALHTDVLNEKYISLNLDRGNHIHIGVNGDNLWIGDDVARLARSPRHDPILALLFGYKNAKRVCHNTRQIYAGATYWLYVEY